MSNVRGILGSDIAKAIRKHGVDPVFIAVKRDGMLCLFMGDESDFEDVATDLWDNGVPLEEGRTCRVCGCSDYIACPGGCYWVEDDLCSQCVGKEKDR